MSGDDLNLIIVLILAVGAVILPIWLGFKLRKSMPGVLWVGILLCLFFGPVGQIYVSGWLPWFLILLGICVAAQQFLPPEAAIAVMVFSSPLIIFFRMRK